MPNTDQDYYEQLAARIDASRAARNASTDSLQGGAPPSTPSSSKTPTPSTPYVSPITPTEESSTDYYEQLASTLDAKREQEFFNKPATELNMGTVVQFLREMDKKGVQDVLSRSEGRLNMREELSKKIFAPETRKSLTDVLMSALNPAAQARSIANAGETALLALGAAGQASHAFLSETVDAYLNMTAHAIQGDWAGVRKAWAAGGKNLTAALKGKSTKEIGDILVRGGVPEPIAKIGGLVTDYCMDPLSRISKLIGPNSIGSPTQLVGQMRKGIADTSRKAALGGVKNVKTYTMMEVLKKPRPLVEYVINPDNSRQVKKEFFNKPKEVAAKEINSMYGAISSFSEKLSDDWGTLSKTLYNKPVANTRVQKVYTDVMESVIAGETRDDLIERIGREFLRNKIMVPRYDHASRTRQLIVNPAITVGHLVNLKSSLSNIINKEVREVGQASPLGALATRAQQTLTRNLEEFFPEYAAVSKQHRLLKATSRQLNEALGKPGTVFEKYVDATGEIVEGSRLGRLQADESNISKLLDYWNNTPSSAEIKNLHNATIGLSQMAGGSKESLARLAKLRALAAGNEFSGKLPKLTAVSIGGFALSVGGGMLSNPATATLGAAGLLESTPRASLKSARHLTSLLSGKADRLTPRMRALQRLQHGVLDAAVSRGITGREGSFEEAISATVE